MQIRQLEESDLEQLLSLYTHLHEQDASLPQRAEIETQWAGFLDNPALRCFGGFVADKLICSCVLAIIPNLTRACRPYALIENVVTHAEHRRRGHGRTLLRHALVFAWQAGCYKAMLMTSRKNAATYAFYESAGFDRHAKQAFIARPGG